MKKPSTYERFHWATFNILSKAVGAEYPPWLLVFFIPMLVLCVLMTKAKPFYPAKYKEWYEIKIK
jgi:hypothetical protein